MGINASLPCLCNFVPIIRPLPLLQVRPCNLDNSGNGSRGCFDFGFPGLACIHCAGQPNSRRFFYRTAEILAGERYHGRSICYCHPQSFHHLSLHLNCLSQHATGNYAHIPNHLLSCSRVPKEIKRQLTEKREAHQMLKHSLPKGSQKQFFEAIWERLHSNNHTLPPVDQDELDARLQLAELSVLEMRR
jgi:hypothetical protein